MPTGTKREELHMVKTNDYLTKMDLQFFAEGGEEGEQDGIDGGMEAEGSEDKTFTQAELDEIIANRIERERKKYADYDDVKTKLSELEKEAEERRLAELSEKERAEELAKKYEQEKSELAEQLTELQRKVEREKVTNAFIVEAQAAGIAYIDDALKLADLTDVKVDGDAVTGIDVVVKELVESRPFLLPQEKPKPREIGAPSGGNA